MSGKRPDGSFVVLPLAMFLDTRMDGTAKDVVALIASYGDVAFPSYKTLAKRLGVHPRTARAAVERAIACGYLISATRSKPGRGQTSNAYTVLFRPPSRVGENAHPAPEPGAGAMRPPGPTRVRARRPPPAGQTPTHELDPLNSRSSSLVAARARPSWSARPARATAAAKAMSMRLGRTERPHQPDRTGEIHRRRHA